MANKIDIHERAYQFALRNIFLVQCLPNKRIDSYVLGRQLLRAATSIPANIEEAQGGFSKDDFIFKMNTAFKEARETNLWLRLIGDAKLMKISKLKDLLQESVEIRNILGTIVKKSRSSNS